MLTMLELQELLELPEGRALGLKTGVRVLFLRNVSRPLFCPEYSRLPKNEKRVRHISGPDPVIP